MESNTEITPVKALDSFLPSRVAVSQFQEGLRLRYATGELSALDVITKAKVAMKYLESIVGDGYKEKGIVEIKEGARDEAERYGERAFVYNGLTVELAEVGARWDYSVCNDPVLARLTQALEEAKAEVKAREDFLKALQSTHEEVDTETGELIQVNPPIKRSTSSIRVMMS